MLSAGIMDDGGGGIDFCKEGYFYSSQARAEKKTIETGVPYGVTRQHSIEPLSECSAGAVYVGFTTTDREDGEDASTCARALNLIGTGRSCSAKKIPTPWWKIPFDKMRKKVSPLGQSPYNGSAV